MKYDLILLHPPSIFDFRNRDDVLFATSSSSNISVSPVYEMYPLGYKAIESYLRSRGKKATVINLADKMLKNPDMDVRAFLKDLNAKMFGIGLHWLAHTHGSLALSKLLKELHKDVPILFGGISSDLYYDELIEYPQVDFIIRGIHTPPYVDQLLDQLDTGRFNEIDNLCWKNKDEIVFNETASALEYSGAVDWSFSDKDTNYFMIFPGGGCKHSCTFCGGSNYSMRKHHGVNKGFVQKETPVLLSEIDSIVANSRRNTTLITIHHWFEDINLLRDVLERFKHTNIKTVHFTVFHLLSDEHLKLIASYNFRPYFEISPQSHSKDIRKLVANPGYTNQELEEWIDKVFATNKNAFVGTFFMIGMPSQSATDVMGTIEYADYLIDRYQGKDFNVFMSPMRPFLDPASYIHDHPEKYGYKILFDTLKDYENALLVPHWKDSMNYETEHFTRSTFVDTTYEAAKRMALVKKKHRKLPSKLCDSIVTKLDDTLDLLNRIAEHDSNDLPQTLRDEMRVYNHEMLASQSSQQSPAEFKLHKFWYEDR